MVLKVTSGTLLVLVAAACGDSTGPGDAFDPVETEQAAGAVFGVVDDNAALLALSVLGEAFSFGSAQAAISAATVALPAEAATPTDRAMRLHVLAREALAFSVASPAGLFPPSVIGNTYVYDPETGRYAVDSARTDAPENGVRFILYAVDPILHQVATPLNEIGYVDLIDESTDTANRLHIVAVVGEITALDYIASAQLGGGGATFSAVGSISDGSQTVEFNLTFTASAAGISIDYSIAVAGSDRSIRLVATGDAEGVSFSLTLTITNGAETIMLVATVAAGQIEGSITFNGQTVVTFSGDENDPIFTTPDGRVLTQQEIEALGALGDLIGDVFDSFEDLLGPAFFVFGFAG